MRLWQSSELAASSLRAFLRKQSKADECLSWLLLVTDCLVCIGFSCLRLLSVLVFSACLLFVPVHVLKRKGRLKPTTTAQFFCDRLRPRCKNPSTVLAMAALVLRFAGALRNSERAGNEKGF